MAISESVHYSPKIEPQPSKPLPRIGPSSRATLSNTYYKMNDQQASAEYEYPVRALSEKKKGWWSRLKKRLRRLMRTFFGEKDLEQQTQAGDFYAYKESS